MTAILTTTTKIIKPKLRLSPETANALAAALKERKKRLETPTIAKNFDSMYDWQKEFIGYTKDHFESCLCAGNQVGKTRTGVTMDAAHLTGDYPEDWTGHRFSHAPKVWILGYTMEKTRDLIQTPLFGEYHDREWSQERPGLIPIDKIVKWESAMGTPNAMRTVYVRHKSGKLSKVQFWSYSQGQDVLMGDPELDWFHIDEEPADPDIRPQVIMRTAMGDKGAGGRGIYTLTPEKGLTDLIISLRDNPTKDQIFMQKGWDDAPHLTEENKKRLLDSFPAHQKDMRSKGEPMLGVGRVFDFADELITCEPFPIPDHWDTLIGIDFGWDQPQAIVKLAIDLDNDIVYVVNTWQQSLASAADARSATKSWSDGIPMAWPADGLHHEKGRDNPKTLISHYEDAEFEVLGAHATWPEGGVGVEVGVFEIGNRMRKGQWKVFEGNTAYMQQFRQYHRDKKTSKIAKPQNDHLLDASRYAYMMRRFAIRVGDVGVGFKAIDFKGWDRA